MTCRLTPRETFLYTLLALRRQAGALEPGVAARKPGAVVVRADFHRGFDGSLYEAARQRLPTHDVGAPPTPAQMRQAVSRINRKLKACFGPLMSARAEVVGPGWSDADGHFGLLKADPGNLRVL